MRDFCGNLDTQEPNIGAEITTEPRINDRIRTPQIRLINYTGEQVGVVDIEAALAMADEIGLDLVEIAPDANPPVCKIMDYGKYKYEQSRKLAESKKKQQQIELKEIKFRPKTGDHDFDVKVKSLKRFLEKGHLPRRKKLTGNRKHKKSAPQAAVRAGRAGIRRGPHEVRRD